MPRAARATRPPTTPPTMEPVAEVVALAPGAMAPPLSLLAGVLLTLAVTPGKPLLAKLLLRVLAKAAEVVAAAKLVAEVPRGTVTWGVGWGVGRGGGELWGGGGVAGRGQAKKTHGKGHGQGEEAWRGAGGRPSPAGHGKGHCPPIVAPHCHSVSGRPAAVGIGHAVHALGGIGAPDAPGGLAPGVPSAGAAGGELGQDGKGAGERVKGRLLQGAQKGRGRRKVHCTSHCISDQGHPHSAGSGAALAGALPLHCAGEGCRERGEGRWGEGAAADCSGGHAREAGKQDERGGGWGGRGGAARGRASRGAGRKGGNVGGCAGRGQKGRAND